MGYLVTSPRGLRRAHGAGEPSRLRPGPLRVHVARRPGSRGQAPPPPALMPRRPPPRPEPLRAHVAPMRGCRSAMTGGRGREGHRRADAGLPERHDRRARSPRAAVARARGCWSAMAGGRRGTRPRRCSAAGLLSAPDSNEENERIRMKRKGHFSHFASDFMCFVF